jgi:hypothetical protein
MDSETKDTTDYVATITPELLNLSNDDDFKPDVEVKCKVKSCSFVTYFFGFILLFILLQLVLKIKVIHYKVSAILNILTSLSFKMEYVYKNIRMITEKIDAIKSETSKPESPKEEIRNQCPIEHNLNYILDFIQQIDKKHKSD